MSTLKDMRKEKGILAGKIAEMLEISYRQYHRIEIGSSKLNQFKAKKLSQIFGVNVTEIEKAWEKGSEKHGQDN